MRISISREIISFLVLICGFKLLRLLLPLPQESFQLRWWGYELLLTLFILYFLVGLKWMSVRLRLWIPLFFFISFCSSTVLDLTTFCHVLNGRTSNHNLCLLINARKFPWACHFIPNKHRSGWYFTCDIPLATKI